MIAFTAAEIAEITNGRLDAEPGITPGSVVTDSREATPGSLYVAKPGETRRRPRLRRSRLRPRRRAGPRGARRHRRRRRNYPAVVVEDAVLAMGALAAESVRRIRAARAAAGEALTVIGITGSAGKTTTKDLLAGILTEQVQHRRAQGSYNGEVGVPLTVFNADADTRYLVIEMGATGVGHIRYLADMVKPGHRRSPGRWHSPRGRIRRRRKHRHAKGELVEALAPTGTAILNLDDDRVAAMAARTGAAVLGFTAEPHRRRAPPCAGGPRGDSNERRREPRIRPLPARRPAGPSTSQPS